MQLKRFCLSSLCFIDWGRSADDKCPPVDDNRCGVWLEFCQFWLQTIGHQRSTVESLSNQVLQQHHLRISLDIFQVAHPFIHVGTMHCNKSWAFKLSDIYNGPYKVIETHLRHPAATTISEAGLCWRKHWWSARTRPRLYPPWRRNWAFVCMNSDNRKHTEGSNFQSATPSRTHVSKCVPSGDLWKLSAQQ